MAAKDTIRQVFTGREEHHTRRFLAWRKKEIFAAEIKNLYDRRDEWKQDLTEEQKRQVDAFYLKNYGKKIPYYWHRMYTAYTGSFCADYLPEIIFSTELEPALNPYSTAFPLQNKAFCPQKLFQGLEAGGIAVPEPILTNCRGTWWTPDGKVISAADAEKLIGDAGEFIIKPTVDTMGARNVRLCDMRNGVDAATGDTAQALMTGYGHDFILQRRVRCHPSIAKLYPNAVNTLRVITYVTEKGIKVAPLSMRIGINGRIVDNAGIFIGVHDDGRLFPTGFSKKHIERITKHPDTGIVFDGCRIEGVPEIKAAAIRLHAFLPQLRIISWDLAYDEQSRVTVIEVNTTAQSVWFPQMVTGQSIFGEDTAEMLRSIKK